MTAIEEMQAAIERLREETRADVQRLEAKVDELATAVTALRRRYIEEETRNG